MGSRHPILEKIRLDIAVWSEADGCPVTARLLLRLVLLEPGFQLALSIRTQEALGALPWIGPGLRRGLWYGTTMVFACHISPEAKIGGGLFLPHPVGIVIGRHCRIGERVTIYQHVTLGRRNDIHDEQPRIEDLSRLYSGAIIVGKVVVGRNSVVGAKALVLHDIQPDHIAIGSPAQSFSRAELTVNESLTNCA